MTSTFRSTLSANTLSRSSGNGFASRVSHTRAKVPYGGRQYASMQRPESIAKRSAPVPKVLTNSKSRTPRLLELPPRALFLGFCCISAGGSGCATSAKRATNCLSFSGVLVTAMLLWYTRAGGDSRGFGEQISCYSFVAICRNAAWNDAGVGRDAIKSLPIRMKAYPNPSSATYDVSSKSGCATAVGST